MVDRGAADSGVDDGSADPLGNPAKSCHEQNSLGAPVALSVLVPNALQVAAAKVSTAVVQAS